MVRRGSKMAIRIAVWVTIFLIVIVVVMASLVKFTPDTSDLHRIGENFFEFLNRITPGD
jgi:hypothetical protein